MKEQNAFQPQGPYDATLADGGAAGMRYAVQAGLDADPALAGFDPGASESEAQHGGAVNGGNYSPNPGSRITPMMVSPHATVTDNGTGGTMARMPRTFGGIAPAMPPKMAGPQTPPIMDPAQKPPMPAPAPAPAQAQPAPSASGPTSSAARDVALRNLATQTASAPTAAAPAGVETMAPAGNRPTFDLDKHPQAQQMIDHVMAARTPDAAREALQNAMARMQAHQGGNNAPQGIPEGTDFSGYGSHWDQYDSQDQAAAPQEAAPVADDEAERMEAARIKRVHQSRIGG